MKNKLWRLKSIANDRGETFISLLLSLALALTFMFKSPLHPWIGEGAYTDSSVFKTIALMMGKGYMPYRDTFDHKGPLLYILNYVGNIISSYRGIWVVEVIFLTITIFALYKTARLSCSVISSSVVTLLSFSLLFDYFEGGNLAEEYAMPFIAISIYIFLDYLKNERLSKVRLLLAGFGFGAVLMLRPNMIAVWIVFGLFVIINLLVQKDIKELINIIVFFILGMMIIILPIIVWLAANNTLSDFWFDYIEFNKMYSSAEGGRALFSAKWSAFIKFSNTTIFIVSFLSLIYSIKDKKYKTINCVYLLFMMVNTLLIVMSGMQYGHYGMIIVPVVAYPLSLMFEKIESIEQSSISKPLLMVVTLYFISVIILPNWLVLIEGMPEAYENRGEKAIDNNETMKSIVKCINQYTNPEQPISVYGNYNLVYVIGNRKHATKYSYQFPIGTIMPEIMEDYFNQLQAELPNVIIVTKDKHDARITDFLDDNSYALVWREDENNTQSLSVYTNQD